MGREAGRSADDTRRLVLESAARVIRSRGITATLDVIAHEAGISKGGLIYHFGSKDALVLELAMDLIDGFRRAVAAELDPDDSAPGRLTRAYLRVSLSDELDAQTTRDHILLTAELMTIPAVVDAMQADAAEWDRELKGDGLPADIVTLVTTAADGISSSAVWGWPDHTPAHRRLAEHLEAITYDQSLWRLDS